MPESAPLASRTAGRADVELRVPADGAYAAVLRTTTAGLAARLDFPIDDIEDLRIAVGESNALALEHAAPGSDLVCTFRLAPGQLDVAVTVSTATPTEPDLDSFAWQVLSTLASSSGVESADGHLTVWITMTSSTAPTSGDDV